MGTTIIRKWGIPKSDSFSSFSLLEYLNIAILGYPLFCLRSPPFWIIFGHTLIFCLRKYGDTDIINVIGNM